MELATEVVPIWAARSYLSGSLMDVERLVAIVDTLLQDGATLSIPSVTVGPRKATPPS
jgi:hypothetical protein